MKHLLAITIVTLSTLLGTQAAFANESVWNAGTNNNGKPYAYRQCKVWKIVESHRILIAWATGNQADCAALCSSVKIQYPQLFEKSGAVDAGFAQKTPYSYICRGFGVTLK